MKKIKIVLLLTLFVSAMSLSSCEKKGCHKPDGKKAKHECSHPGDNDSAAAESTT